GTTLLPSLAATLAWPSRYGYADIRRCAAKEVDMKLYYLTGACSLASNIALRDAGLKFELVKVDRHTKKAADGLDFKEANPKAYARKTMATRFDYLQRALRSKSFLMGAQYTVADAYLFTVRSWARHVEIDLGKWPQLRGYVERVGARPHVIEALESEGLAR